MGTTIELNGKTPKSLVHEFCAKERVTPTWNSDELQKTPPKFKSRCIVPRPKEDNCINAEGFGSTKKEAEHNASLEVLAQLGYSPNKPTLRHKIALTFPQIQYPAVTPSDKITKTLGDSNSINTTTDDVISDTDDDAITGMKDPIGDLITLCRRFKLQLPEYKIVERKGPANSNIFTATCTIDSHVVITKSGKRFQKHKAKKIAAYRALREFENKYIKSKLQPNAHKQTNKSDEGTTPGRSVQVDSTVSSMDVDECEGLKLKVAQSNDITTLSKYEAFKLVYPAGQSQQPSIESFFKETLANAQQALEKKVKMEERSIEEMQVELTMERVKRKLEDEEVESVKRLAIDNLPLFGVRLICHLNTNECLKYVKDFAHIFQHQECDDKIVDNILVRKDFLNNLQSHGGPTNFLQQTCKALKLKLSMYRPVRLQDNKKCVFIKINTQFDLKNTRCNVIMVNGSGDNEQEAKINASIEALKTIRLLVVEDN